uniref:Uncharacterized protein n=1 Tax=Cacopsylla melanoneura TaxID=428564 RepID=A0A8D8YPH2_9HEMI
MFFFMRREYEISTRPSRNRGPNPDIGPPSFIKTANENYRRKGGATKNCGQTELYCCRQGKCISKSDSITMPFRTFGIWKQKGGKKPCLRFGSDLKHFSSKSCSKIRPVPYIAIVWN